MLLAVEPHGDVTRLVLASPTSRLVGYSASAYVVDAQRGAVLVDTGFPFAWRDVRRFLESRGGARGAIRGPLRGALVTPRHEDHAGNAPRLAALGVPLAMAGATRRAIARVAPIAAYRRYTWGAMPSLDAGAPAFDPAPLVLVPTPGHTSDHHAVWDPERETFYGGDLFLGVQVRVAHRSEDPRALARSLRAAAALRPRRLFDGHRGLVAAPVAALEAKAAWTEDTIAAVEQLIDRGWPDARIRDALLGGESAVGRLSRGEYSRVAFVSAIRRTRA